MSNKCKYYRKSEDKKYDFFCEHFNAPICGDCSNCDYYEEKQETEGDLISRSALKEQVKNEVCEVCFTSPDERQCSPNCKLCTFNALIDNAPTVPLPNEQVAWEQGYEAGYAQGKQDRPQGEWEELSKAFDSRELPCKCSFCGHILSFMNHYPKSNFCPNCGAKMKGGSE